MSLIGFHRVLIGSAVLFCAGFAAREAWRWAEGGGAGDLALAVVFAALAGGLAWYLLHLPRFLGRSSSS